MSQHIKVRGGYYDVGRQLGERTALSVQTLLQNFKESQFYKNINQYIETQDGRRAIDTFKKTVHTCQPAYIEELQGVSDGAGVKYEDLFLFNCDSEFAALLKEVPGCSHDVKYASLYDGCTNISIETLDKKVLLAHTEDISPAARDLGVMITVDIVDVSGQLVECWTDYYLPGVLPGSKFTVNNHGVMLGGNNILQKGINPSGIPRKFMSRSLLSVRDAREAVELLQRAPGIASAYCYHYLQKNDRGVQNTVVEVAGTSEGSRVEVFHPNGFYYHCNLFQHLQYECHPEESSVHRAAVLSQYVNRDQVYTKDHLLNAVSNRQDAKFPVYRSGTSPDYLATGATGIFDAEAGTLEVYTDVPEESKPTHVFNVARTQPEQ